MPYGQFTGYEPLPNGQGYMLQTKDGTRFPAVGAEAESIRQKIDASNSAPTSLASAASAGGGAAPQPGAYQPGQGPAAPPTEGPPAQPASMFRTKDGVAMLKPGGNPQNPADWFERVAPRAGSRGGLGEIGRTIQGGYNINPEERAAIEGGQEDVQETSRNAAASAKKAMAERQAMFDAARQQVSKEAVEMVRDNTRKQQGIDDLSARYSTVEKEFLEMPEKQKAEREGQKGRTVAEAIAGALGALGASMARTPNFAAQVIESNRERDLRNEEAALRVKKDAKDSLLGRLRDEMGSMELAKTAFRAIRTRQDALALEQSAAKTSDAQRQQDIMQVAALQNQNYQKWHEAWLRGADGEVTRSLKMHAGSAGSSGGDRPIALSDLGGIANVGQSYAGTNKTNADIAKTNMETAAGPKDAKAVPVERTSQISEDAALLSTGSKILGNPAIQGKSDVFEAEGSLRSKVPLIGDAIAPENYKAYEQDLQNWTNSRIKAITGAGMSETEAVRIARGEVGENRSINRVRQGVEKGMGEAANRLKANFATLPPEQQQQLFKQLPPNVQQMLRGGQ